MAAFRVDFQVTGSGLVNWLDCQMVSLSDPSFQFRGTWLDVTAKAQEMIGNFKMDWHQGFFLIVPVEGQNLVVDPECELFFLAE